MSTTAVGSIAVIIGIAVLVWDARRSAGSIQIKFGEEWRAAVLPAILAVVVFDAGQAIATEYWGPNGKYAFTFGFFSALALGIVVQAIQRLTSKLFARRAERQ